MHDVVVIVDENDVDEDDDEAEMKGKLLEDRVWSLSVIKG